MRRVSRLAASLALPAALLLAAGCKPERAETFPDWSRSRAERLALFAGVEKLAVVTFRDPADSPGLSPELFARLAADELVPFRRFKVIYPADVAAAVEEANRETRARAGSARQSAAADELIDPERSELDAVAAGRAAGADAVLVAAVHDFEVYPPKRLAVTFRVYLCAAAQRSLAEVVRMTDDGVPAEVPAKLRERFVWERQVHYDSGRKGTRMDMSWHARKHEKTRGFGDEVFYYATEKFLAFAANEMAGALYGDSLWYTSAAARRAARAPSPDAGAARTSSGFKPGGDDRGLPPAGPGELGY